MKLSVGEWLCVLVMIGSLGYSAKVIQARWASDLAQPVLPARPDDFCPVHQVLYGFQQNGQPLCREILSR